MGLPDHRVPTRDAQRPVHRGPAVEAFDREAADYLGAKHAIGVNSGNDALVIDLRALGVSPDDEVITTPVSDFATAESIGNVFAAPVCVDIDERTFKLAASLIKAVVTDRTRAILSVCLYGRPCKTDAIMDIADGHGLAIVEDCAQSFGARCRGQQTGTIGHVGACSFFPSKNLVGFGDGRLVATHDDTVALMARKLRWHGSIEKYRYEMLGYNRRLDALQAALPRVKPPGVDGWNECRREAGRSYDAAFAAVVDVVTPELVEGHAFHQHMVRAAGLDEVRARLETQGVGTMVYCPVAQDRLPVYWRTARCPVSDHAAKEALSLPIGPCMPKGDADCVTTPFSTEAG